MKWNVNVALNLLLALMIALLVGRYFYLKPRYHDGEAAPDFTATRLDGESFRLSGLRGNYVLLDFWGSWCGPCRAGHPDLVRLYRKYAGARFAGADGFRIVSVGIERNADSWRRAIEQDGLSWPDHILDTTRSMRFFNGPIAGAYGVSQIPASYLIDGRGIVIGVNLPVGQVDRLLAERRR